MVKHIDSHAPFAGSLAPPRFTPDLSLACTSIYYDTGTPSVDPTATALFGVAYNEQSDKRHAAHLRVRLPEFDQCHTKVPTSRKAQITRDQVSILLFYERPCLRAKDR